MLEKFKCIILKKTKWEPICVLEHSQTPRTLFDICTKMHVLSCEKTLFWMHSACQLILKAIRCIFCTQCACRPAGMKILHAQFSLLYSPFIAV